MSFMDEIRKIPPVTRFLCAATAAVTLPVMAEMVSPYKVLFVKDFVVKNLEIWRIPTSFFLASMNLNFIFDVAMLYRTSNSMEEGEFAGKSPDYAWQLAIASVGILGLNIPLKSFIHFRALLLALTYLSSSLAPPGAQTSLFGLITVPVKYWPYVLVALDGIMGGRDAAAQAISGCIVGHAWWWAVFESRSVDGRAPRWVKALVSRGAGAGATASAAPAPSFGERGSGVETVPPRAQQNARQEGYNWGGGHRLGSS